MLAAVDCGIRREQGFSTPRKGPNQPALWARMGTEEESRADLDCDSALRYHKIVRNGKNEYDSLAMNKTQQATLNAVFQRPTKADIRWSAIESLVRALGGEVSERAGSRVAARLNGVTAIFHRPHPRPETKKGAVDAVRQFFVNAGVKP